MSSSTPRGMPLLSGLPPTYDNLNEQSCRKCNKEFNVLFARSRKCNHCGFLYCHSCTDFQALMPRSGPDTGYDPLPVCAYCIENLTITAGGRTYLRSLNMTRLKKYANAYNIDPKGALEKDEFIDALIAARQPNGCLPHVNEDYYRKRSIPNRPNDRPRGLFGRAMDAMGDAIGGERPPNAPPPPRQRTTSHPSTFPRQQQQQRPQQRTQYQQQRPQPSGQYPSYGYQQPPYQPYHGARQGRSPTNNNNLNVPPSSRPRSASVPRTPPPPARPTTPPPPVPSLDALLDMTDREVKALSIGTLKAILFRNHVNARLVVEKEELVSKVKSLLEDERRERADSTRRAEEEERETQERIRRLREQAAASRAQSAAPPSQSAENVQSSSEGDTTLERIDTTAHGPTTEHDVPPPTPPKETSPPSPSSSAPVGQMSQKAQAMASHLERTGLCVICQDEEANIAIVDCGHLAMCRPCSDLIMSSTRECPLCRTRIVTEARLLRIFKS